jgi:hypothetical protein
MQVAGTQHVLRAVQLQTAGQVRHVGVSAKRTCSSEPLSL